MAIPFSLSLNDGEGIGLVAHSCHRGDDAARLKVDHVEVTELLRERRRRGSSTDQRIPTVGRDRGALRPSRLSVGPDEGDACDSASRLPASARSMFTIDTLFARTFGTIT